MRPQTLSKSRFRLALECPTKVYYSLDRRYANRLQDDEFMAALAEGGHQVGALARAMFRSLDSDAVEVTARDQDAQDAQEAPSLSVVEETVKQLLPKSVLESLAPRFKQAQVKLNALQATNPAARCVCKVRMVSPTLPLLPPEGRCCSACRVAGSLAG